MRTDSDINSVKDPEGQEGRRQQLRGNFDLYLRHILDENGLDPKNDVQILEVPIAAVYQALDARQIDVGVVPALFVPRAEATSLASSSPSLHLTGHPGHRAAPAVQPAHPGRVQLLLKNGPEKAAKAFLKVILDTQSWAQGNVAEGAAILGGRGRYPALAQMQDPFGPDTKGKIDVPSLELDIQLVNKFGYSKTQPAATAFLDESLVDEINAGK